MIRTTILIFKINIDKINEIIKLALTVEIAKRNVNIIINLTLPLIKLFIDPT